MANLVFSVAIVTAKWSDEEIGRTVTSFMPLSAVPPRIMISIDARSRLIDVIGASRRFSISFLDPHNEAVGDAFAGKGHQNDRFATADWDCWPSGNRKLVGACLSLDCELSGSLDAEDHIVFVGTIVEADASSDAPALLWTNRSYRYIARDRINDNSGA